MKMQVFRNVGDGPDAGEWIEVDPLVKVSFLTMADKSDPLNQLVVLATRAGKFVTRITFDRAVDGSEAEIYGKAVAATLALYLDAAPEIRDALAEERHAKA